MKTIGIVIALLGISGPVLADQYVNGYYRKDGTYVEPHYRSSPNNTQYDNYGYKGNTNPYTGEKGRQDHRYSNPEPNEGRPGRYRTPSRP